MTKFKLILGAAAILSTASVAMAADDLDTLLRNSGHPSFANGSQYAQPERKSGYDAHASAIQARQPAASVKALTPEEKALFDRTSHVD